MFYSPATVHMQSSFCHGQDRGQIGSVTFDLGLFTLAYTGVRYVEYMYVYYATYADDT